MKCRYCDNTVGYKRGQVCNRVKCRERHKDYTADLRRQGISPQAAAAREAGGHPWRGNPAIGYRNPAKLS